MARRWLTPSTEPPPAAAATDSGPSPAQHFQWDIHRPAVKIAIFGNVVVVVFFFSAVVWRLFFSGKDHEEDAVDPEGAGGGGLSTGPDASSSGVASLEMRKMNLMAMPAYVHRSWAAGDSAGKVECAVCICELRNGDTGRLLPKCVHRFHAECVDRWFRSNDTCPLCRAVVDPAIPTQVAAGRESCETSPS